MPDESAWGGSWIASRFGDYKHAAPQASRKTLCGMPYVLMSEDAVRHQPACPRCVQAATELEAAR